MTKIKITLGLFAVVGIIIFWVYQISWKGEDKSILEVSDGKIVLVNVAAKRGMVNNLIVAADTWLWIPGGDGWILAENLAKNIKEKKMESSQVSKTIFYNFGFWPEIIIDKGRWYDNSNLMNNFGPGGWLRIKVAESSWFWKDEVIADDLLNSISWLDEVMVRDMAKSEVMATEIKVEIINQSGVNGLGNFLADRLEWWGLLVVAVGTDDLSKQCKISTNKQNLSVAEKLKSIFNCELDSQFSGDEIQIRIGEDMAQMLKYNETYVRTF